MPEIIAHKRGSKKRLYLSPPQPDLQLTRRAVTRYIPPTPPPRERTPPPPPPVFEPLPPPPPVFEPLPPPPPPCLPEPKPEPIEVISVDVDPPRQKSRSRSRRKSRTREVEEVYIERDHYIPVPYAVETQPKYDTYRYVEAPRYRRPSPPPQRRMIEEERIVIDEHRRIRERDYYER